MAEPWPPPPKHRVSLTEVLTVDDLINLVSMKARTRTGRIITGVSSVVLLGAIIFVPIVLRSSGGGAGPSSTPTIPVVTITPSTNAPTAFVPSPIVVENLNDRNRYGGPVSGTSAPTTAATTPATPAPTVTTTPTLPANLTAPVTSPPPPVTTPPTVPAPPPTFQQPTPTTAPPLTVPVGPITPGH